MKMEFPFVFLPIVILYLFLAYTRESILFSNTMAGKLIAICIIVFYTNVNVLYGVFVCMLLLVYYQTDFVEEILRMEQSAWMENRLSEMNDEIQYTWINNNDEPNNLRGKPLSGYSSNTYAALRRSHKWARTTDETTIAKHVAVLQKPEPKEEPKEEPKDKSYEGFQSNTPDIYRITDPSSWEGRVPDKPDKKAELMAAFRKEHCVNGVLLQKGMEIRPEMTEHIFREFKPDNEWNRCNPCDSTCSFSIIEERIQNEIKPVDSNDFFQSNLEYMKSAFTTTTDQFTDYFEGVKQYATFV